MVVHTINGQSFVNKCIDDSGQNAPQNAENRIWKFKNFPGS